MTQNFLDWIIFAQDKTAAGEAGPLDFLLNPLNLILILGILFYVMMIRPENRKRANLKNLLGNLKKNDRVVTIGGIFGTVVNAQKESEEVTIRVDDSSNVRIRVLRSAISRVIADEKPEESGKSETK